MVQAKIIAAAAILLTLCSCGRGPVTFGWQKFSMDGHRTGVTPARDGAIDQTLGRIMGDTYTSPNGNEFKGATFQAARDILAVQDSMAPLRVVVGTSVNGMELDEPESPLSDWVADGYMKIVERKTGMHVDLSLANFGGIRCDMPQGEVIKNDILSMFPFKNHFCVVRVKGNRIWEMFDGIAASSKVQPVGGIRLEFKDKHLVKALIGGKPLRMDRTYNLATIDFLLDGGDNIYASKDADEVINTGILVRDGFMEYLSELEAAGQTLDYQTDGRMKLL